MKKYCMYNKSIIIQLLIYFVLLIVMLMIVKYCLYIFLIAESEKVFSLILVAAGIIYIFLTAFLIPMRYKSRTYYVSDDFISVKTGILIYSVRYINLQNIRFVSEVYIPVLSRMGCCFLIAGGCGARIVLTFLSQNDSKEIAEFVRKRIIKNRAGKGGALL